MRFEATMATRQANVDEALAGLREGIAGFLRQEPDAAAVERAANTLRGRLLMRRLTRINQAYFAALARLEGRSPDDDLARLEAMRGVTPQDVRKVLGKYLDVARCATIVVR
jgi:predicted Zn-dependent peptidase